MSRRRPLTHDLLRAPRMPERLWRARVRAAGWGAALFALVASMAAALPASANSDIATWPAGEERYVTYPSEQSLLPGGQHPLGVFLPAGWDPERAEPYPLLVLSHGAYDDQTAWFDKGAAVTTLDRAMADGAIPATVVVTTSFENLTTAAMGELAFFDAYAEELRDAVLPFVESEFHVSAERADRSFGGLSMGGALGLSILKDHPDLFAHYGIWSAAADLGADSVAVPSQQELERMGLAQSIHMGTGVDDELEGIGARSQERAVVYRDLGLPVTIHDIDGGHTWEVWQQQLEHFVHHGGIAAAEPQRRWGWIGVLILAMVGAGVAIAAVRRGSEIEQS
ncbi:MAG: alpha/beta hydrolase [Demequina sp.]